MPTLVLARHAHATHNPMPDHERYLTPEGVAEAQRAADYLAQYGIDYAVSSTATRTQQTLAPLLDKLGMTEHRLDSSLYGEDPQAWLETISTVPPESTGAYIVGHNPTVWAVAEFLTGASIDKFRPSAIAVIDLEAWEAGANYGRLIATRDFVSSAKR